MVNKDDIILLIEMGSCQSIDTTNACIPRQGIVSQILIHNYTWNKRYLGLYDYQAIDVTKSKLMVQGNSLVLRQDNRCVLVDEKMDRGCKSGDEMLKHAIFRLVRNDNYYQLTPIVYEENKEFMQKPVWLVIKSLPSQSYSIKQRDILKLGKQKLRVREVITLDNNLSVVVDNLHIMLSKTIYEKLDFQEKFQVENVKNMQGKEKQKNLLVEMQETVTVTEDETCRICLQPGLLTNPLITPCKCLGSVRHIHLLCLKAWLAKQIKSVITDFCVTINWKPLSCQMCKTQYKYRIYLDNQKFYTVDIPKPEKPYIVLQIVKNKATKQGTIFKFITFKNKQTISIGRKKDVDVKISDDISVSRVHATIKYNNQKREFILQDNKSKFGTLVLAKYGLLLRPHYKGMSVQIGAEIYEFQPLREIAQVRAVNYDLGEDYMRQEMSEESQNQDQEEHEEEDLVMDLHEADRSPLINMSPLINRSQSMVVQISHLQ